MDLDPRILNMRAKWFTWRLQGRVLLGLVASWDTEGFTAWLCIMITWIRVPIGVQVLFTMVNTV